MTIHWGDRELDVVLRDGSTVHVCPAKPADGPAVRLLLRGLSDRSRWLRFFSAYPDLAQAARWATEVDSNRRFGLVATVERDGRVVGHAGMERESDRPERAEVALEVADAMQGMGLGTALLSQLAEAAHQLGIQVLDAEVLAENRQMLRVLRDCGYPVKVHNLPGVQLVELRTSLAEMALKPREPHSQAACLPTNGRRGAHDADTGDRGDQVRRHRRDRRDDRRGAGRPRAGGHGAPARAGPGGRRL